MRDRRSRKIRVPALLGAVFLALLLTAGSSVWGAALGGPDGYGYHFTDSRNGKLPYGYENIEKTATHYADVVPGVVDNYAVGDNVYDKSKTNLESQAIEIGFDFKFYGKTYNYVYLAGNGYIEFTPNTFVNYVYDGSRISATSTRNLIAPLWGWHDAFS